MYKTTNAVKELSNTCSKLEWHLNFSHLPYLDIAGMKSHNNIFS